MAQRTHPTTFTALTLAILTLTLAAGPAAAGGANGVPQNISARMVRLQAQQNYATGRDRAAGAGGDSGAADPSVAAGGTGTLIIGDFSRTDTRNLRESNILVNGDIINWNSGR
jgi:hypothetical protein